MEMHIRLLEVEVPLKCLKRFVLDDTFLISEYYNIIVKIIDNAL